MFQKTDWLYWVTFKVLGRGTFGKVVLCREKKNKVLHIFQHRNIVWFLCQDPTPQKLGSLSPHLVGFQKLYAMKILRKEVIVSRGEVRIEIKQSNCLENNIFLLSRAWQFPARIHHMCTTTVHSHHPHHPREGGAHHGGEEGVREQRPPFHHQFEVFFLFAAHSFIISLKWKMTRLSRLCKTWLRPTFL